MIPRLLDFALQRMGGLNAHEKLLLSEVLDRGDDLVHLDRAGVSEILGRPLEGRTQWDPVSAVREAVRDERMAASGQIFVLKLGREGYPAQLAEIYNPPFLLFGKGEIPSWDRPHAAIVGTRMPTEKAKTAARDLGRELALQGAVVVSGLARGIDTWAHQGALDGRGITMAVLGNGIDAIYPTQNRDLARRILAGGGCILSEYGCGVPPHKYRFPARNRIISGLSRSVVMVQAPEKSGALITTDMALEQGRDVFVHQAGQDSRWGAGGLNLAQQGAAIIACAKDILFSWEGKELLETAGRYGA